MAGLPQRIGTIHRQTKKKPPLPEGFRSPQDPKGSKSTFSKAASFDSPLCLGSSRPGKRCLNLLFIVVVDGGILALVILLSFVGIIYAFLEV